MPWVKVRDFPNEASHREIREVEEYRKRGKKTRFYADENFPARAVELLRSNGFSVLTAQEAGKRRHPDENHLAYAQREHRILVTCDRDFLNERRFPLIQSAAVMVFNFGEGTLEEMRRAFVCLLYVARTPQFYDRWVKFDVSPNEWTALFRFQDGTTSRDRYRMNGRLVETWID